MRDSFDIDEIIATAQEHADLAEVKPDESVDYAYFFTIWNGRHISGYPALFKDVGKTASAIVGFYEHNITPPVVTIIVRYRRALNDGEVDVLADEIRGGLTKRKIPFVNIELTHVARVPREVADGSEEEGNSSERPVAG